MLEDARTFQFTPPPRARARGLQMAPLIDIVFLLICFYLLVAQLVKSQKDPAVELPLMVRAAAQTEMPAEVVVNLRDDGRITVNGRFVTVAALPDLLAQEMAKAIETHEPFRVVVRADRRQRFARLDEVLAACKGAGLTEVVFRAREGADR